MFQGASKISLDTKGRLAIPKRQRERIADCCEGQLVVTVDHIGQDCLQIYPAPTWHTIATRLVELPSFDDQILRVRRLMLGFADEVSMDKAGRILIAPELREFAGLEHKVVLTGQGNKFELWDEAHLEAKRAEWRAEGSGGFSKEALPEELRTLSL